MSNLLSLWLVWLVLGGVALVIAVKQMYRWWLAAHTEEVERSVDGMGSETFAAYVAKLLAEQGYRVHPILDDYGADLILECETTRMVVQTRRQSEYVGVGVIQQVVAAKAMYDCSEAMVVTNTMYAQSALQLAQSNQVVLWDRPILLKEIADRQARRRAAKVRTLSFHRLSSLSAFVLAGALVSVGLVGLWRQGSSVLKVELAPPSITNSLLHQPDEPSLSGILEAHEPSDSNTAVEEVASEDSGILEAHEPADRNTAVEGSTSEDGCGSAVVQDVAALAIREAPSLQSAAVGEVPQGRRITLICDSVTGADGLAWQLVDYGLGRGWMSRKYLLVEQP